MGNMEYIASEAVKTHRESMEFLKQLVVDFVGRQCGTPQGRGAGNFLSDSFKRLGVQTTRESFSVPGYLQKMGYVSIRTESADGVRKELFRCESQTLIYSPVTLSCGLLYVHSGEMIPSPAMLKGKVVVSEESIRSVKTGKDDIIAWIYITPERTGGGHFISSLTDRSADNYIGGIPSCSVSWADGQTIKSLQETYKGNLLVEVKTDADDYGIKQEGVNIISEIPRDSFGNCGTVAADAEINKDEYIIVGSHYDTFLNMPGATDNAAGTAVLYGAAKILTRLASRIPFQRAVKFIAFDGEELGLLGSSSYVERHTNELELCRMMVNLDCTGKIGRKSLKIHAWDELLPDIRRMSADLPLIWGNVDSWYSYRSDHQPFWRQGIPTVYGYGGTQPLAFGQHTQNDSLEKVIEDGLLVDTIITAELLFLLATAEELPWENRNAIQMIDVLKGYNLFEEIAQFMK